MKSESATFDGWWRNSRAFAPSPKSAALQVERLVQLFSLRQGERVLDLACGRGDHAKALAKLGINVTALDINARFLDHLSGHTADTGLVRAICRDMRQPFGDAEFDYILSLNTSFGYFRRDERNRQVLLNVVRALANNGQFICDLLNRDYVIANFCPRVSQPCLKGGSIETIHWMDDDGKYLFCRSSLVTKDKEQVQYLHRVRLYLSKEFCDELTSAGLVPSTIMGDWSAAPLSPATSRMIVVSRKYDAC